MAPWPESGSEAGPAGAGGYPGGAQAATPNNASRHLHDLIVANCTAYLMEAGSGPGTIASDTKQQPHQEDTKGEDATALDEFQIIKAVVLGLVTSIILLSICKMVFQLFVRYAGKADDR